MDNIETQEQLLGVIYFLLLGGLFYYVVMYRRLRFLRRFEGMLTRLVAGKPLRAVLICFAFGTLVSFLVWAFVRKPMPFCQDEYSYLMGADTFAHGRLSNPTPPSWQHFEVVQVIVKPTFVSKYPPGQALFLAFGMVLGDPAISLWLGMGIMCGLLCWMLQAFLPGRWAFAGGMLLAFHPTILKWSQSFWGGQVAFVGGLLVIGAVRRLMDKPQGRHAVVLGIGLSILAISRPFEGIVLTVTLCAVPLVRFLSQEKTRRLFLPRVIAPLLCVVIPMGGWMLYYNYRTTGNIKTMPYMIHEATYFNTPFFVFQKVRPAPYVRHASMRKFTTNFVYTDFVKQTSSSYALFLATCGKISTMLRGTLQVYELYTYDYESLIPGIKTGSNLNNILWPVLLALPIAWKRKGQSGEWLRLIFIVWCVYGLLITVDTWMHPHYAAPGGGLFAIFYLSCMRQIRVWQLRRKPRSAGRALVRLIILLYVVGFFFSCFQLTHRYWNFLRGGRNPLTLYLQKEPGKHLVFVDHRACFHHPYEWVYNQADLPTAKIVWARYLTPEENRELVRHFPDRKVWLLQPQLTTKVVLLMRPYNPAEDNSVVDDKGAVSGPFVDKNDKAWRNMSLVKP